MCHSSFTNEASDPSRPNNERLEFLGDAVLGVAVADELFRTDDALNEGTLTVLRSQIVSGHSLSGAARRLKIGKFLSFSSYFIALGAKTWAALTTGSKSN